MRSIHYVISLLRVIFVLVLALFLPQFFIWYSENYQSDKVQANNTAHFKLGVENISPQLVDDLKTNINVACSVGLITNHTGTDQAGNPNIDILQHKGFVVKKIFMPQIQMGNTLSSWADIAERNKSSISVIPIAQQNIQASFTAQHLKAIDALIFDIQDVGMRYYGYVSLLLESLKVAATYNKKFVVLDRPNLLGCCMEGALDIVNNNKNDCSALIPTRYGMTIGELAHYFNKHILTRPAQLYVVPMKDYNRTTNQQLLCSLSTNIPTIESCYGYSFLGLLGEVSPFDIAVGTDKSFQCLLLPEHVKFPKQKWHELRRVLSHQGIESKLHRCFSQRKKEYCSGLRLSIQDINRFSSFNTLLAVLTFFKESGISLQFSPQFDKSLGTNKIHKLLDGSITKKVVAQEINASLRSFFKRASDCFIYKPFPKLTTV